MSTTESASSAALTQACVTMAMGKALVKAGVVSKDAIKAELRHIIAGWPGDWDQAALHSLKKYIGRIDKWDES